jgi:DNA polymerase III subunit delta
MARKKAEKIEDLKNAYFIYGDEELLAEEALDRLKNLLGEHSDPDFNYVVMQAGELDADQVIDAAETLPLLCPRRLVVVRDADRLGKAEQEKLAVYLESSNPATTIVLVAHFPQSGETRDSRAIKRIESGPLYRAAAEHGEVLKLSFAGRGKQARIDDFVSGCFKERGKKVRPEARQLLIERVGKDLRELEDSIERLCLYAGDLDTIGAEEVELLTSERAERDVFEFVDAVADRRRDQALFLFNRLMRQGESPQRLFGLLLRQFRLISRVKALAVEGDFAEIGRQVGIPPFVVGKCLQQSKRFSKERLRSVFGEFRRAQVELHSTKYLAEKEYQEAVVEMLIARVIG